MKYKKISLIAAAIAFFASSCGIIKQNHRFECRKDLNENSSLKISTPKEEKIITINDKPITIKQVSTQPSIGQNGTIVTAKSNKVVSAAFSHPIIKVLTGESIKTQVAPIENILNKDGSAQNKNISNTISKPNDGGGSGALGTIGWVIIVLGILILLLSSIIVGIILMLVGLLFVVQGKK